MNHLRNVCSTKRIKYISNNNEILFDINFTNEEALSDI